MDQTKWPARASLPIAQPGLKFVISAILITGVLFYLGWMLPAWIALAATAFTSWFFRDPDRTPPEGEHVMVSPADGRVIAIDDLDDCAYMDGACIKVSIFMNVFNVHVNRMPLKGQVEKVSYYPGKFLNASFDKASEHNERNALVVKTAAGERYTVVQIAGLIARRIVNCINEGESLKTGERYGMIQFGSRLDLYLPPQFKIDVQMGQKTKAGSTVIGYMQ